MEWWIWATVIVLLVIIVTWLLRTKKSNGDLLNQSQSRLSSIGDCCKRAIGKVFGA
jgi:hypothetical protein